MGVNVGPTNSQASAIGTILSYVPEPLAPLDAPRGTIFVKYPTAVVTGPNRDCYKCHIAPVKPSSTQVLKIAEHLLAGNPFFSPENTQFTMTPFPVICNSKHTELSSPWKKMHVRIPDFQFSADFSPSAVLMGVVYTNFYQNQKFIHNVHI